MSPRTSLTSRRCSYTMLLLILFGFSKTSFNERLQLPQCLLLILAMRVDGYDAAFAGREHHNTHDAFAIDLAAALLELNLTGKVRGEIHELRGCAGVHAELVDNRDFFTDHDNRSRTHKIKSRHGRRSRPC